MGVGTLQNWGWRTPTPVPPTPTPIPPTPTPSITVEDFTGLWQRGESGEYLQLKEDGTYRIATSVALLETLPTQSGEFRLEGTLFTFITSNESKFCPGLTGHYQVELTEQAQLQFVLQEDPCQLNATYLTNVPWIRVETTPGITAEDLTGVWKKDGAGVFFQLDEDGTYAFADVGPAFLEKAPIDTGEFRLEGTSLTFITSDESAFCAGQTGSYQVELTEQGQLQFELEEDLCQDRADGVPGSWSRYEP